MSNFNIPVALFIFKRADKTVEIIRRISIVKPKTVYLLSDGGRDADEKAVVEACREKVESAIDWDCTIVRRYSNENIGIYKNIAEGARWVFSKEEMAIFLEDDNLPEVSFFWFCEELLDKYKDDTRILWICGTNYLKAYEPLDGSSYVFTKNMMPCGWASWANKFTRFYDGELILWRDLYIQNRLRSEYLYKRLYYQDSYNFNYELDALEAHGRFYSWDYQMAFTMRVHNLYAIVPKYNQIKNIGVDSLSTHGGNSKDDIMVERFCGLPTRPLEFPLVHPDAFLIDEVFESKVERIICDPRFFSFRARIARLIRRFFKINRTTPIASGLRKKIL